MLRQDRAVPGLLPYQPACLPACLPLSCAAHSADWLLSTARSSANCACLPACGLMQRAALTIFCCSTHCRRCRFPAIALYAASGLGHLPAVGADCCRVDCGEQCGLCLRNAMCAWMAQHGLEVQQN